ncbi:MAG TPA: NAD-dependent epimerase/dehydratase family protein [Defluviicoccus sp.]|nr:NAD-dependent epimerase/dehydratase family protein [Defluviicoccus sp.]
MADKVIVIGGSGFIGTRLVEALIANGEDVLIFDKKASLTHHSITTLGDVNDLDSLRVACKGRNLIYNLAAEHRDDVRPASLYNEVNVGGAETVCLVAEENSISRIIFSSSVAVYGPSQKALTEESPHNYISKYGESKSRAEHVYKRWRDGKLDRSLVIVRPTAIFGPGSKGNVHNLILQIKSGRFVMVGAGNNKKSIGYVSNVADLLVFLKSCGPGLQIYNYADKPDFTMRELVTLISQGLGRKSAVAITLPEWLGFTLGSYFDIISKVIGAKFPINRERVEKFCSSTEIDSQNAFATGFVPKYTIGKALQLTVQDYVTGSY